jgi:hypothetical protein
MPRMAAVMSSAPATAPAPYSLRIRLALVGVTVSWTLSLVFFYLGWRSMHGL